MRVQKVSMSEVSTTEEATTGRVGKNAPQMSNCDRDAVPPLCTHKPHRFGTDRNAGGPIDAIVSEAVLWGLVCYLGDPQTRTSDPVR